MSSIDQRVVEARFDNRQFQEGVKSTMNSLDDLKRGLTMPGATKGLDEVASATGRVSSGLNVMRVAAYTAIATIAHQATLAGEQFVRSFTVGPLLDGLHEYETQLGSIQTILSNTQWEHTSLKDVNGALSELNHYSDKTIYNFSEMARNIGTFTAAGVKLDTSVNAIKGIANLAAVSGSNAQQASTAMYQLSQALSTGTVKLMDWNSVVNAGMGGKVFQDALKETARVHGVAVDKMIKENGSFRDSLQEGWLTSKILTETLSKFTGDLSRDQLKQMGYTEKQIDGIIKLGKTATDAATKVKTGSQLLGTLQEAAGSGWAKSWQLIIGNFHEAEKLWTHVNNVVGGAITSMAKARNQVLGDWKELGGRDAMIKGISNAFKALMSVLEPIKDAFREIFPAKTGQQLYDMTVAFKDFMANLKIGADTAENLKRIFAGFFAVLDIGWQIVKAGVKFIGDLLGAITAGEGSGGIGLAAANLGDWLVALDKAVKTGSGLTKFFQGLGRVLQVPINLIKALAGALLSVFNLDAPSADGVKSALSPVGKLGELAFSFWNKVQDILHKVFDALEPVSSKILSFMQSLGDTVKHALSGLSYDDVLHTINTGLFAGLLVAFKTFVSHITSNVGVLSRTPGQLIGAITSPFHALTATLGEMQKTLRSAQLVAIATAIGIMTASLIGLAGIDPKKLGEALGAMSAMFAQLFASVVLFQKFGGAPEIAATSSGLILLAVALRVLTSSVIKLSVIDWQGLAKGLLGVSVLLASLAGTTRLMSSEIGGLVRVGAGLLIMAFAIKVLVSAVTDLSGLSWGQMSKGLVGVGALLASLAIFTKFVNADAGGISSGAGLVLLAAGIKILASAMADIGSMSWGAITKGVLSMAAILAIFAGFSHGVSNPASLIASGAALILLAVGMKILAKAIGLMAQMSWGQIAKGVTVLAASLIIITAALEGAKEGVPGAAAVLIVAAALRMLAPALAAFAEMSWGQIGKAMTVLGGSLLLMATAVNFMTEALPGAAAVLVVAAAMRILAPVLLAFGNMSWTQIAKGMVVLAGAFAIIGVAAALLTPVIPSVLGLGIAIALLGAGMLAAGAGIFLFATGLTALAASAGVAVVAIVGILKGLIDVTPLIAKAMGLAIVAFAKAIASAAPAVFKTMTVLLEGLLKIIDKESPKILVTFTKLMFNLVDALVKIIPKMADGALKMILGVLHAVADNAPKIVNVIIQMVINILKAMADRLPDVIRAGVDLIVSYLEGIAQNLHRVIHAGVDVIIAFIKGVGKNAVRLANAAADVMVDFINGISKAIDDHADDFRNAGLRLGWAIANGMSMGMLGKGKDIVMGAATTLSGSAEDAAKKELDSHSPSKKFEKIGMWAAIGFANGLIEYAWVAQGAAADLGKGVLIAMHDATKSFRVLARYLTEDFFKGLVGGKDEIVQTLSDAKKTIHDTVTSARDDVERLTQSLKDLRKTRKDANDEIDHESNKIDRLNDKLDKLNAKLVELNKHQKKNKDEINSTNDAIKQTEKDIDAANHAMDHATKVRDRTNDAIDRTLDKLGYARNEYHLSTQAYNELTKKLDDERTALKALGKEYDVVNQKLQDAKQLLQDAIRIRDDYKKSITDQFSQLPDITPETKLADYEKDFADYLTKFQTFVADLAILRDEGLNDAFYKELLSKGVDILPFIEQIVAGGQTAVDELNGLSDDLADGAADLGDTASTELYQAGVDAAQGIVDGLKQQKDAIKKEMEDIANVIAKAIADALGLPYHKHKHGGKGSGGNSKTKDAGKMAGEDLVIGITEALADNDIVEKFSKNVGDPLVDAMKKYVDDINKSLGKDIDVSPTIVPILDLSDLTKKAAQIPGILSGTPISTADAFSNASDISWILSNQGSVDKTVAEDVRSSGITFVQNNNSPKALTTSEIYRQTKNQISTAKGVLGK